MSRCLGGNELQSVAPEVVSVSKEVRVYRSKSTKEQIYNGRYFAIEKERSAVYANKGSGFIATFRATRDLKLVDLTAQGTIDWMNCYCPAQFEVLEKYLDLNHTDPRPYGAVLNAPFADNDNCAPAMESALQIALQKDNRNADGWCIPQGKKWPPSSKNNGSPFHSEIMLYNWRDCLKEELMETIGHSHQLPRPNPAAPAPSPAIAPAPTQARNDQQSWMMGRVLLVAFAVAFIANVGK